MKTITKTFALLVAAAAFTACTNQAIEPASVSNYPQSIIAQLDTLIHIDYTEDNATAQPVEPVRGTGTLLDDPTATPTPRKPIGKPVPPSGPQPVVTPIAVNSQDIY